MNNLWKRIFSGIALIIIFAGAILVSEYTMFVLMLIVYALSILEYRRMVKVENPLLILLSLLTGSLFILFNYLYLIGKIGLDTFLVFTGSAFTAYLLYYLFFRGTSIQQVSSMFLANAWIAVSVSFYIALGWISPAGSYNPEILLIVLSLIWINDIAAYVFGSILGKRALAPAISPAKTVEGFLGGILINAVSGYLVFLITEEQSMLFWIIMAITISLGATAGDLFESKLKREAGVKDSGNLIPGHGGVLDRFDSLYFSAPLVYIVYLIFA